MQKAIFAAGCFWGVEDDLAQLPGVVETEVGYIGGNLDNPSYEDVCSGTTGHAEGVQVTFDPDKIKYETLVEAFFKLHDPTQVNRQGPDVGTQYRSAIFTTSLEQDKIAHAVKDRLQQAGAFKKPIATLIEQAKPFWRAEEYHQKYNQKHRRSCHI